jgi:hypothetical protein
LRTYEVTADSDVEDDVQGLGNKGLPDSLAVDSRAGHPVELDAVLVPDDGLLLPVSRAEVELTIYSS